MEGIQWNLLDANAPAKVGASFNLPAAFNEGQQNALVMKQQQMAMEGLKAKQAQAKAYQNALASSGGDRKAFITELGKVDPAAAMELEKAQQGLLKDQQGLEKGEQDKVLKMHTIRKAAADAVVTSPEGSALQTAMMQADQVAGMMGAGPEQVAQAHQHLQQIFEQGGEPALRQEAMNQAMDAKDKLSKMQMVDTGPTTQFVETNPMAPGFSDAPIQMGMKPGEQQRLNIAQQNANQGVADSTGDAPTLSQEALDAAAYRYGLDGTIPSVGIGKVGSALRASILNRWGELSRENGIKPEDQRGVQIGTAVNKSSMTQLAKQQAAVGAFELTFNKNVELARQASNEVDRTGMPIVNKWVNAGKRAVVGDPALSKFDISIKAAVNEYTKIISGSMGNTQMAQAEIEKVNNLLNAAQTAEQVETVLSFMQQETKNRMEGFDEQAGKLKEGMKLPGKREAPINAGPKAIKSDADYDSLPSGAEFIAPDGSHRRKP